ncbi:23S rRNA (uracil1939-C5)-methyltransferase [Natronobacillus azotifigens]|uniref:23S rRNA (Uracil(1939)-C(5))-methyltransferase RlmD n=1 Tax=Natronobacillus azotifigens TaxID=472978 RepID=A0A9J6RBQ4_9BACI|nr:23S rRNA (uracil(1939)-C(5))-methyltransferase RlmD [Natronobacillus azotifigens]MCZ0702965.1 23S rRNA (uracil(1939)-C(5))-methyltransferase RlmD [Natronobacillus azotifigens]
MQTENSKTFERRSCPVVKECGGCQIQHLSYQKQIEMKQKQVETLLNKFCKVKDIIAMDYPYYYRNKIHATFDTDRKGKAISGIYQAGTHKVVSVDSCLLHDQRADNIIVSIREMLRSFKIRTYNEDTRNGLLRHVLIRTGYNSKQIMVVLVLASHVFPSRKNFIKALMKKHPEITTVVLNVNNKKTSMVLGQREQVLYGKGFIEDTLCEKVFRISPKSFYQVNPVQTDLLYNKAIELASFQGNETIIDAYCGIGTIGLIASDHVKKVIGVELNRDAVKDAINNAKRNNVKNVYFHNEDAGDFMIKMAREKQSVDAVIMDPPRAGSTEAFLRALTSINPKKVVYISCNPVTLKRDLESLVKKGYQVQRIVPVDMFPGTSHVECIALMSRTDK